MNIYLDLDGTLIDVSERQYRVHTELLKNIFGRESVFSKPEYWELKRKGTNDLELLKMEGNEYDFERYHQKKILIIEDENYLKYDECFPNTAHVLGKLSSNNYRLVLVSLRQNRELSYGQIEKFGLSKFMDKIIFNRPNISPLWKVKADEIKSDLSLTKNISGESIIVGDTEGEYYVGRELGIKVILVGSGSRNKEVLKKTGNQYILDGIQELPGLISKLN